MLMNKLRLRMLFLHEFRRDESEAAVKTFVRSALLQTALMVILMGLIALTGDMGPMMTVLVLLFTMCYPYLLLKRLDRSIAKRKLLLLLELPVFVNKLLLLIQSGLTLHAAMLRSADSYAADDPHPFARHMVLVAKQLRNAYPFAQVMEELARRCGTQEVTFFTSAVLMNYKRGGEELTSSLRHLSRDLWEKRKTAVKTLGEEASAKMIFPLIVVFMTVMVAVGAPALMQLNE